MVIGDLAAVHGECGALHLHTGAVLPDRLLYYTCVVTADLAAVHIEGGAAAIAAASYASAGTLCAVSFRSVGDLAAALTIAQREGRPIIDCDDAR